MRGASVKWSLHSFHSDAYCVVSATVEGYATPLQARVVRMGEPLRPVHLVMRPATACMELSLWEQIDTRRRMSR